MELIHSQADAPTDANDDESDWGSDVALQTYTPGMPDPRPLAPRPSAERRLTASEQHEYGARILAARNKAIPLSDIAVALGISYQTADRLLRKAVDRYAAPDASSYRVLQLGRYEALLRDLNSTYDSLPDDNPGKMFVADRIVSVLGKLDTLMGTKAATKVDVDVSGKVEHEFSSAAKQVVDVLDAMSRRLASKPIELAAPEVDDGVMEGEVIDP